jgi:molybdenum cofactor guanylyltransferase
VTRDAIAGIVLTGGASRRLGVDKARLQRADGSTLAEHAAALLGAACEPLVEVGPGVTALAATREQPPGAGPLAALLAGCDVVAPDGPVVVLACDYPALDADAVAALVTAQPRHLSAIAEARGRLHYVCARWSRDAIAEARRRYAAGERALRWVEDLPHVAVALPDARLADVDTPADAAAHGLRVDRRS